MDLLVHFRSHSSSEQRTHLLHPPLPTLDARSFLFVLRDSSETYLYLIEHAFSAFSKHATDVGRIYTAFNHLWLSMLYDRKASSSSAPAPLSRIPDSWHYQLQNRYLGVTSISRGRYVYTVMSRRVILTCMIAWACRATSSAV